MLVFIPKNLFKSKNLFFLEQLLPLFDIKPAMWHMLSHFTNNSSFQCTCLQWNLYISRICKWPPDIAVFICEGIPHKSTSVYFFLSSWRNSVCLYLFRQNRFQDFSLKLSTIIVCLILYIFITTIWSNRLILCIMYPVLVNNIYPACILPTSVYINNHNQSILSQVISKYR